MKTLSSKYLSLILRHKPEVLGIELSENGWASVDEILSKCQEKDIRADRELIEMIVREDNKTRYAFNEDHTLIRANQGHSVAVSLGFQPVKPPNLLYHGTATRFLDSIRLSGLTSQSRQHVHLSDNLATAENVGRRHGKLAVLIIESGKMHRAGYNFYCSDNNVWLTDHIPTEYIQFS